MSAVPLLNLSLISSDDDDQIAQIRNAIAQPMVVEGRADVERVLSLLARARDASGSIPCSLDLIGHSTPERSLLAVGDWVVDGTSSKVLSFFRGLVDCDVLARIGVRRIRLLGCETAMSEAGKLTLHALAEITDLEVFGTRQVIDATAYDRDGFRCDPLLVSSTEIRHQPIATFVKRGGEPFRRVLDIEMLPASPLGPNPNYPRRLADLASARQLLALIRRTDGAQMPGLSAEPTCEIGLPSSKPGWWHRLQVVLDGEFVRVYPDGDDRPGVLFPVTDSKKLGALIASLQIS